MINESLQITIQTLIDRLNTENSNLYGAVGDKSTLEGIEMALNSIALPRGRVYSLIKDGSNYEFVVDNYNPKTLQYTRVIIAE